MNAWTDLDVRTLVEGPEIELVSIGESASRDCASQ